MPKNFDYTTAAQRFASRHPLLAFILTQISFWIVANVLLGTVIELQALSLANTYHLAGLESWGTIIFITIILGIIYGTVLGSIDYSSIKSFSGNNHLAKSSCSKLWLHFVYSSPSSCSYALFFWIL